MIQPRLKIMKRCLEYHGWLETLRLHSLERLATKVVNEAQRTNACRPDVNMSALGIFVTKPLDGCLDIDSALPFPQNHLAAVALDTDVETTAAFSAQLDPYESLDYHD